MDVDLEAVGTSRYYRRPPDLSSLATVSFFCIHCS